MRKLIAVVLTAGLSFATGLAQAPQAPPERKLQISFEGSNVSLVAQNVTVREILTEWSRLSGCIFVNADRLTGGPIAVPFMFDKQPQRVVLEALLRGAAGIIATPRRAGVPGATDYEVVYILATSNPTASPYSGISNVQAPITNDEVPPIPAIREEPQPAQPPPANKPTIGGPVYIQPIISNPPPATATPPATSSTTGRGRGNF
jgi:hypothetical protein